MKDHRSPQATERNKAVNPCAAEQLVTAIVLELRQRMAGRKGRGRKAKKASASGDLPGQMWLWKE